MTDKRLQMARDNREADYQCGQHDGAQAERAAIVAWLLDAIEQGYQAPSADQRGKCEHNRYYFEDCIACYDEFLVGKLDAIERGDHITHKER